MFNNIAKKLKGLAKVVCWLGIVLGAFYALLVVAQAGSLSYIPAGIIIFVVIAIISWVSSFVLYGFGQIVENTDKMAANAEKKDE